MSKKRSDVIGRVTVSREIFIGDMEELMNIVKAGGRGDVTSLCALMPQHGFCHLKKNEIPYALTPFNTVYLDAEKAILSCDMDCGNSCNFNNPRANAA